MNARVHLGDGAYVRGDGWYLWVEAQREGGMHRVALEPSAVLALVRYAVQELPDLAEAIISAAGGAPAVAEVEGLRRALARITGAARVAESQLVDEEVDRQPIVETLIDTIKAATGGAR